jgi:hypothetical protein
MDKKKRGYQPIEITIKRNKNQLSTNHDRNKEEQKLGIVGGAKMVE